MYANGGAMPPIAQNVLSTHPSSAASSTSKIIAQNRLQSLLYPGEQSLSKFGWSDRVKEYLAEIKLSKDEFPNSVRRLSHVMTHKQCQGGSGVQPKGWLAGFGH